MADFGGEMRLSIGGVPVVMRGTFQLDPTNVTAADITNMNGSVSRNFKPDAYGADLKEVEDSNGLDWNSILRSAPQPIVIVEELTGVTHQFGNAVVVGKPIIDRETGGVTGLQIRAPSYIKKAF